MPKDLNRDRGAEWQRFCRRGWLVVERWSGTWWSVCGNKTIRVEKLLLKVSFRINSKWKASQCWSAGERPSQRVSIVVDTQFLFSSWVFLVVRGYMTKYSLVCYSPVRVFSILANLIPVAATTNQQQTNSKEKYKIEKPHKTVCRYGDSANIKLFILCLNNLC